MSVENPFPRTEADKQIAEYIERQLDMGVPSMDSLLCGILGWFRVPDDIKERVYKLRGDV